MKPWAGVCRLGGIGDNLIAASVCAPLKKLGYNVEMIAEEGPHVVFLENPNIDKLSLKNAKRDLPQSDMVAWQQWFESRRREYEVFVHLSHSCEGKHALFPAMTQFYWPLPARRKFCAGSYLETVHDIAGVPYEFGPLFHTNESERYIAATIKAEVGERVLGWVLSGTRVDKFYPQTMMAVARIIKELDIPVILFGGPSPKEYSSAEAIKEYVISHNGNRDKLKSIVPDPATFDMSRQWGLVRPALALLQACDIVITPDTGPAWAVAMEAIPKVVMVSHASAENITSHWINTTTLHADQSRVPCWPCHRLHSGPETCVPNAMNNGAKCISDISVEQLIQAIVAADNRVKLDGGIRSGNLRRANNGSGSVHYLDAAGRDDERAAVGNGNDLLVGLDPSSSAAVQDKHDH